MSLDIDALVNAIDNEDNLGIMNLDFKKINQIKNDMLQRVGFNRETLKKYNKSLKEYRYIDELSDIKLGGYVRWVPLLDPTKIKLTTGGVVCDVKLENNISIVCKNRYNQMFEFKMTKNSCIGKIPKILNKLQLVVPNLTIIIKATYHRSLIENGSRSWFVCNNSMFGFTNHGLVGLVFTNNRQISLKAATRQ